MTGSAGCHAGLAAGDGVAKHYQQRDYTLANTRWRGRCGEIDLIMRYDEQVIFVEVKKSASFAKAAQRLGRRQMDRLCTAATEFLAGEPKGQLTDVRFDLAVVNGMGAIKVIENAFMEA